MERFRIAQYGFMQAVALAYGILASGAAVKIDRPLADLGHPMPALYYFASTFRDYGAWLFVVIFAWAVLAAFYSSSIASRTVDEGWIVASGMFLVLSLFALGSVLAFGAGAAAF